VIADLDPAAAKATAAELRATDQRRWASPWT
jgi:hypothetical protein